MQNQYFVTVAKAESASDAFLERERDLAVAGRNQASVQSPGCLAGGEQSWLMLASLVYNGRDSIQTWLC